MKQVFYFMIIALLIMGCATAPKKVDPCSRLDGLREEIQDIYEQIFGLIADDEVFHFNEIDHDTMAEIEMAYIMAKFVHLTEKSPASEISVYVIGQTMIASRASLVHNTHDIDICDKCEELLVEHAKIAESIYPFLQANSQLPDVEKEYFMGLTKQFDGLAADYLSTACECAQ